MKKAAMSLVFLILGAAQTPAADTKQFVRGTASVQPPKMAAAAPADIGSKGSSICVDPGCVGELLDPRFLKIEEALAPESKAEWARRVKANQGQASFALLSPLDPTRDLLLCVPGHGQTFRDMHALAQLEDTYQVAFAVLDETIAMDRSGKSLALAVEQFMRYRNALGLARNIVPRTDVRILAHSMGGGIAQLALQELVDRKKLYDGEGSIFSKVNFIPIDSIWRGLDLPWILLAPGLKQLTTRGELSLTNRARVMNKLQRVNMPGNVTTNYVTIHHRDNKKMSWLQRKKILCISNWYSNELLHGELQRLWDFLRYDKTNMNSLDNSVYIGLIRKQGLQNLMRTLQRDADYQAYAAELKEAATGATSLKDFAERYDKVVAKIVDTFDGPRHTEFMWEDPDFLPWLRKKLQE